MQRIIEGKKYDTKTAQLVYGWTNDYPYSDFRTREKTLYRTEKGAWFIHHEGGAMTDMAVSCGNNVRGSESIEAITEEDAYGFLEAHSEDTEAAEAIQEYFADRIIDA